MSDTVVQLKEYTCRQCGAAARMDPRFVQWCTECGDGADPQPPKQGGRARRAAQREQQRSMRLFESLRSAPNLRPTSAVGVAVTVLSTLVHLSTLALLVVPAVFVAAEHEAVYSVVLAAFAWASFFAVRPRFFGRLRNPDAGLDRAKAPVLYALFDRCAAELGCPVPDKVYLSTQFNASTARVGRRRIKVLVLGAPLWTVLSGQERLALLGHELAHQVNGDTTHGLWAVSARRTIDGWTRLLDPRQSRAERITTARSRRYARRGSGAAGLSALLAPLLMAVVFAPFFLLALGARILLTRLDLYCGQRAEYLADELAARLAGSEAAHGCMAELALGDAVLGFLRATRNSHRGRSRIDPDGLWPSVAQYADSVPETERQRRMIVDRLHNTRTDRSHPANHLRLALLAARPQLPAALTVTDAEWAALDAELEPGFRAAAREILG